MKMLVVGTYPLQDGPLICGTATFDEQQRHTCIDGVPLENAQGISALLGAAYQVTKDDASLEIIALLGGDIGKGDGTRAVFKHFKQTVAKINPDIIVFHYMQPIMALIKGALVDLDELGSHALLVADAGGMYAAKAAGVATRFELMTPDIGEIGFLAQKDVPHPAYVSHFLFGNEDFDPLTMAQRAFKTGSAAHVLLIKGSTDTIVVEGALYGTLSEPNVPILEAIGGTGDTLTGLCAGLMLGGLDTPSAALEACRINRNAGLRSADKPSRQASDIIASMKREN